MNDLRELYQDVILDHGKNPRNFHAMQEANHQADGHNPLCGDRLTVFIRIENDRIAEVSFQGSGCAISVASASVMSQTLEGKTLDEAEATFQGFHDLVTGSAAAEDALPRLGKLAVFSGVSRFPVRVKCATLPWHTLRAALASNRKTVSTE